MLPRRVRLALCRPDGAPIGLTPALDLGDTTWWPDAASIVAAARDTWRLEVVVLRLARTRRVDGVDHQTYTAETVTEPSLPLDPADPALFADEPLRMPWAKPGGPDAALAWAATALAGSGIRTTGTPEQLRSWNLSTLWRLPTDSGIVWLKAVPPFFAHEGAVLDALAGHPVPHLIARTDGIALLADIRGEDLYEPTQRDARRMIDVLLGLQTEVERAALPPELPSWSVLDLARGAERTLDESRELEPADRATVAGVIENLPATARALEECGIPETLVHGDFHPGNVRGTAAAMTLLDWGDSGWGHPLLDAAAFTQRMDAVDTAAATTYWMDAWRAAVPGSDPERALALLAPVSALRQAVIYQAFLDRIEPAERVYHSSDPLLWLRRAAELAR